jgi:hypothetical protein
MCLKKQGCQMVLFNVYAAANHPQISKLAIRQERKEGGEREQRGEGKLLLFQSASFFVCLVSKVILKSEFYLRKNKIRYKNLFKTLFFQCLYFLKGLLEDEALETTHSVANFSR